MDKSFEIAKKTVLGESEVLELYALTGDWDTVEEWAEVANRGISSKIIKYALQLELKPTDVHKWLDLLQEKDPLSIMGTAGATAYEAAKSMKRIHELADKPADGSNSKFPTKFETPEILQPIPQDGSDPIQDLVERFISKIEGATEYCRQQLGVDPKEFKVDVVSPADAPTSEPTIYQLDECVGTYQYEGQTLFGVRREGLRFFIEFTDEFKPNE